VGAYVTEVVEGASADRAGIQVKDIIIALGEYEVKSITDLTRNLRHFKAGDTTTITIIRGGAKMDLTITFDERPEGFNAMIPAQDAIQIPEEGDYEEWFDYFRRYFGDE
jgi:predicted metalloprotease with PDZ domain